MFSPDSSSSSHTQLLLTLPKTFLHSRRLLVPLIHYPITTTSTPNPPPPDHPYSTTTTTFDANVVMILSVLLCALICSLALNSVIRCILHCTNRTNTFFSITPPNSITPINRPKLPNTGIKKKALKTFTTITYTSDLKLLGLGGECVICLSEFTSGEKLRLLPRCNHGFHLRCIDKWLDSHSSCPTCRNCLIETCEKIVGDNNQQSSNSTIVLTPPSLPTPPPQQTIQQSPPPSPPPPQETVVDMPPLEREGPINTL